MDLPATENEIQAILDQVLGYLNFSSGNHDDRFFSNLNDLFLFFQSADSSENSTEARTVDSSQSAPLPLARQVQVALSERLAKNKDSNPVFRDATQANQIIDLTFDKILPAYRKHHRDLLFHQTDEILFNSFFVGRVFFRFHPQRFMFFRSHPQRFICFYDFLLSDLCVFPISSSDSTPGHRLQGYAASRWSLLSHLLGCPELSCDYFARWSLKCSKTTLWCFLGPLCELALEMLETTLWMPPGTTLRAGA